MKKGFGKSQEIVEFYNVAKIEIEGEFLKRSNWKLNLALIRQKVERSDINYSIERREHL